MLKKMGSWIGSAKDMYLMCRMKYQILIIIIDNEENNNLKKKNKDNKNSQ